MAPSEKRWLHDAQLALNAQPRLSLILPVFLVLCAAAIVIWGGFVLLDRLTGELTATAEAWQQRVHSVIEDTPATDSPVIYRDLTGLLVRPDGIIAWATTTTDVADAVAGFTEALTMWAGAPATIPAEAIR